MSYDRIWIERSEDSKRFLEWRQAKKMGLCEEFNGQYDRLYKQGHFVVLSTGKNFMFDELFLFEDAPSGLSQ